MAHRGRTYPNHFRRDFNFNSDVSNPERYAKGYTVTLDSGVRPGYIVDGHTFLVQEIAGPDPGTIAWLSPSQRIGIWDWQLRLHVSFFNLPTDDRRPTWFLERDAILVSSWRGNFDHQENAVVGGSPLSGTVIFTDELTFERGANFNFSITDPTRYVP